MEESLVKTATISDARRFSLDAIQKTDLVEIEDLSVRLLCFEAGQEDDETKLDTGVVYQVLEGEALVRSGGERTRLGKGRVMAMPAGTTHTVENAGGGLLVVMATSRR
jgi:quercetin dioxygenase-like cupin family protein